jgi:hypothetical protein
VDDNVFEAVADNNISTSNEHGNDWDSERGES